MVRDHRDDTGKLEPLGLTAIEERVYRHIINVRRGSAEVTALILRLGGPEVEQALERLGALGLITRTDEDQLAYVPGEGVEPSSGRETVYVAEPPSTTLGPLLNSHAAQLIGAGTVVEQLAELYRRRRNGPAGSDQFATVVTGEDVNQAVYDMLTATRVEIVNLDRQPFVDPRRPQALQPAMLDVFERGVTVRTIYAADAFRVAGYNEYMNQASLLGEQSRLLNHLPMRFLVSDGATAMLPLASEGPWITAALIVDGHALVEDLRHAFEELWTRATPLSNRDGSEAAFTEGELLLLRMLSSDMTEGAMGRHLGASARTVGRRLAVLQHKLGAQTRFGMGAEAARRGLL